jgi:acyl carrier protein
MGGVYEELTAIVGDELGSPPQPIGPDTLLDDIPGWDSVTLAGVLLAIESRFGVAAGRQQLDGVATGADLARLCRGG